MTTEPNEIVEVVLHDTEENLDKAALAYARADSWARSPIGTRYGSTVPVKGDSHEH